MVHDVTHLLGFHSHVEHSDPETLKGLATERRERLRDAAYLLERQKEIREVLDEMKQKPTEATLIKLAVAVLTNETANDDQKVSPWVFPSTSGEMPSAAAPCPPVGPVPAPH